MRLVLSLILLASAVPVFAGDSSIVPAGDPIRGEQVFVERRCFRCHTVEAAQMPDFDIPPTLKIHLGGANHRQWTRDAYAQAIMNPEHVISPQYQAIVQSAGDPKAAKETPMPNFNRELTVSELIDITTFLAAKP
jgi:mono/diheme cytochrome c family protein